jgi:hypothetical protein
MKTLSPEQLSTCNRRQALALFAVGAGVATLGVDTALASAAMAPAPPVTAYFLDGLVRDTSGRLPAYRAPRGYGGGRGIARLDEAALRMSGIEF